MSTPLPVLAACRHARNLELLAQFLARQGYPTRAVATLEELDAALAAEPPLGLALIDLSGFDARIWRRCDELHQAGVPFLLISAGRSSERLQQEGLRHGARGVLGKPLAMRELASLIESLAGPPGP